MRHQAHTSFEELRPFVFRDPEDQVILGQIRRKRNPSPFFTLFDKPPAPIYKNRRESFRNGDISEDLFAESIEVPQTVNRDPSYERGASVDEKYELDVSRSDEPPEVTDEYDPNTFNELGIGKRTVIRHEAFIASTLHLELPERVKTVMNEDFVTKYPSIHLTMSKMKSIKREMIELAKTNRIDVQTLAIAFVYFEKIVIKVSLASIKTVKLFFFRVSSPK